MKKALSLFLSLALVFAVVPVGATYADDDLSDVDEIVDGMADVEAAADDAALLEAELDEVAAVIESIPEDATDMTDEQYAALVKLQELQGKLRKFRKNRELQHKFMEIKKMMHKFRHLQAHMRNALREHRGIARKSRQVFRVCWNENESKDEIRACIQEKKEQFREQVRTFLERWRSNYTETE